MSPEFEKSLWTAISHHVTEAARQTLELHEAMQLDAVGTADALRDLELAKPVADNVAEQARLHALSIHEIARNAQRSVMQIASTIHPGSLTYEEMTKFRAMRDVMKSLVKATGVHAIDIEVSYSNSSGNVVKTDLGTFMEEMDKTLIEISKRRPND